MSSIFIQLASGKAVPVDPRFNPICGFDESGNPVALTLGSGGGLRVDGVGNDCDFLSSTDGAVTGKDYIALRIITDTVLSSITLGDGSTGGARLVGPTILAPAEILAPVTGLTISSGVVQGIKRNPDAE